MLWAGAVLRMGDHRLAKRAMSGELENAGKRGPGGEEKNGRTAWQMIFGYLASRGTGASPHLKTWAEGEGEKWTDCVADDLRLFGITGDWSIAALDPGVWYSTVHAGGYRFMDA